MDRAPDFDANMWPDAERESLRFVSRNLSELGDLVTSFRRMLALYRQVQFLRAAHDARAPQPPDWNNSIDEYMETMNRYREKRDEWSETGWTLTEWGHVAILRAVMLCFGFKKTTGAISINLNKMPTAREMVDHEKRKSASTKFNTAFPDIESLRVLAAHPGEIGTTPDDWDRHSAAENYNDGVVSAGVGSMVTSFNIQPDSAKFSGTSKNKMVEFELSEEKLVTLSECALDQWSAFLPLESDGSKWMRSTLS